jgi:type IV pilus assembly protein PilQ
MLKNSRKYLAVLCVLISLTTFGQDRFSELESKLEFASKTQEGLNKIVNISVNHYTLQEVIRAIAQENSLNISVDPSIHATPSYNFANATVKDVFLLLCKEHDLTLEWTGQIISFKKFIAEEEEIKAIPEKTINLTYTSKDSTLSGTLSNDTLYKVIQKISQLTNINIDVAPSLRNEKISMTIVNQKFTEVLTRFAGDNEWLKISDNFYQIKKKDQPLVDNSKSKNSSRNSRNNNSRSSRNKKSKSSDNDFIVELVQDSLISVEAVDADLKEVLSEVCNQSGNNYFIFDEPKGNITLTTRALSFDETLSYLLNTSDFTYRKIDSVYIIGDRNKEKFRHTETFQFQYRTIEGIPDFIPADLKKDIEIQESIELNSLILSGSLPQINELKRFFLSIDKVVPMVLIEVMIVDINRTKLIETGLAINNSNYPGDLGNNTTGGTINGNPNRNDGLNSTLSTATLNRIIASVNNLGFFNLGDVGSGFYVSMNALETSGNVKIVSTPKLAALNGHEAEMSIGETTYYKETSNNFVGSQITTTVQSFVYKPLNADLSLTIKPVVSGDDQITLEISVSQSNFTSRVDPDSPPGNQKREFKSIIRMKNKEMVVLGGLDNNRNNKGNVGVPILNRIPVIKWFFSKQIKEKTKSELTIFIRPTVIQ